MRTQRPHDITRVLISHHVCSLSLFFLIVSSLFILAFRSALRDCVSKFFLNVFRFLSRFRNGVFSFFHIAFPCSALLLAFCFSFFLFALLFFTACSLIIKVSTFLKSLFFHLLLLFSFELPLHFLVVFFFLVPPSSSLSIFVFLARPDVLHCVLLNIKGFDILNSLLDCHLLLLFFVHHCPPIRCCFSFLVPPFSSLSAFSFSRPPCCSSLRAP